MNHRPITRQHLLLRTTPRHNSDQGITALSQDNINSSEQYQDISLKTRGAVKQSDVIMKRLLIVVTAFLLIVGVVAKPPALKDPAKDG